MNRNPSRLPLCAFHGSGLARPVALATLAFLLLATGAALAQQASQRVDPSLYSAMRWRLIGPHRGGRVTAVAGIPGDPATYYMGTPGGGVWKTTSGGRVWTPIFDDERVASIGAIAIAASDPNTLYVGTGEQTDGDGIYKSTDAGATWTHAGLKDVRYISSMIVDPRDPNIVLVGALGHPILGVSDPSPGRGVFKSTDGGKTWTKTLYRDDMAGVSDLCSDPGDPRVVYAALWHPRDFRRGPAAAPTRPDGWIYKSTDEGSTWKQLAGTGLPTGPVDRIGLAVAPSDHGRRVFAIMGAGLFRSDEAGETWRKITNDPRILGNGYICRVYVDPRNADVVYIMQTSAYRSADGGQNFDAYKGAPGGDDYQVMWIDPQNSQRIIFGVDQGATISVDGGKTWTSWFNQPTGQFYHVTTDNQFPYYVYAAQQDSGTAAVPSRSDYGEVTYRDWFSIGGFESCYIAPDPANPNIVYSGGWYGSVVRFDKVTGQITHVFVRGDKYRTAPMPPLVFSPHDSRTLYFGTQCVLKTTDGGASWQPASPDVTKRPEPPASASGDHSHEGHVPANYDLGELEEEQNSRRATAITTLALSTLEAGVIWAGTSNGLIQLTRDAGKTWENVSPPALSAESPIDIIEASHYDRNTAYAVVAASHDSNPYIYRTHDGGKTWRKITDGLQASRVARVVREDPVRKGLLYAGTENAVYVSADDGDHWQSLELNLPATDVRDLAVHENDLVAATFGRALWILDDLSPLRQADSHVANSNASLLRPAPAVRVRWDNNQETPLPPEFPAGKNPPDGAILDYYLKSVPSGELTLEIHDAQGNLVRRFTSVAPALDNTPKNVPDYWFGPPAVLTKNAGMNRFVWDLRYDSPPVLNYGYFGDLLRYTEYTLVDHAIPGNTPREQTLGPLVVPGKYEAVFIGNGMLIKQPLTITLDPRVHVSQADLVQQLEAAKKVSGALKSSYDAFHAAEALRAAVADRQKSLAALLKDNPQAKDASDALEDLDARIEAIQGGTPTELGFGLVNRDLAREMCT